MKKIIAIGIAFCVAFTSIPMMMGGLESSAMAKKKSKVAKNVTVSAAASGQTRAVIKWNKIKKPNNGYAVFRNGTAIAHMGKKYAFTDTGLKAGTSYTYQIRTYKTKKVKQWYNKATGKWQKKKPKKKWRGKSRKITTYIYKKKSNVVTIRTAPKPVAPTPAPLNKYTITWKNYNGVILQSTTVLQGNTPSYTGSTPTRPADDYIYTFKGWSPAVTAATGNRTYVAQYTAKENLLPAPTGITYKMKSNTSIKITWNSVTGAEKYAVLRNGQVAYVTTNFVTDSTLTAGDKYTFQIAAVKNGKIQKRSQEFTVTAKSGESGTVEDTTTPTTPTTPTTETKQVTDYLGVTRTITKSAGESYWYTTDGTQCNPIARYDKTVDGTFNGFTQKNSVTWKVMSSGENYYYTDGLGSWNPYVVMYNGDTSKLTFEIANLKDISTHYSPSGGQIEDRTITVIEKNGKRLAKYFGDYEKAYWADKKATAKYASFEDRETYANTQGLGFTSGTVTVNVLYNGAQIGQWTHTFNADANSKGLSPYRQDCLELAEQCIAAAAENGEATGSLEADMQAISTWLGNNYTYGQNVGSVNLSCYGGRDVLETWSIYKYGKYGFAYKSIPGNSTHEVFCLDDLSNYWAAQGYDK